MIFRHHPDWPKEKRSTVERAWEGQTVVCFATGPSLSREQVAFVQAASVRIIAVNDAYLWAPFADVCYFADVKWWKWHKDRAEWKAFAGEKCSIHIGADLGVDPEVHLLENAKAPGLSLDPKAICTGSNSGYQAINIAVLAGARRVILLGYDGKTGPDGREHFFGHHPDKSRPPYEVIKARFRELVAPCKAAGVEVINSSPGTVIDCFPLVDIATSLQPAATPALV